MLKLSTDTRLTAQNNDDLSQSSPILSLTSDKLGSVPGPDHEKVAQAGWWLFMVVIHGGYSWGRTSQAKENNCWWTNPIKKRTA